MSTATAASPTTSTTRSEPGATRQGVLDAIGVAVMMGGGPAVVYGSQAYEALAQFEAKQ